MTLPPVMRVFFAIDLPRSAREVVGGYIGLLKKKSKSHAIRWSRIDNLHITLQFLAEVRTEHLPGLIKNVRAQVEGVLESTTIGFGHLHLFPNPFRPRVIVLDILPQDDLTLLSGLIAKGIQTSGYELDSRPFHAHLTLGRIKQPQEVDLSFVTEKSSQPEMNDIDVSEVVLFRSEPQSDGNVYSVLERIVLEKKTMMG